MTDPFVFCCYSTLALASYSISRLLFVKTVCTSYAFSTGLLLSNNDQRFVRPSFLDYFLDVTTKTTRETTTTIKPAMKTNKNKNNKKRKLGGGGGGGGFDDRNNHHNHNNGFSQLGLSTPMNRAILKMGFRNPTPVQRKACKLGFVLIDI